ncbi:hypothetical protein Prudu_1169S002900 [Prunus dulcis]|uniref:Uncharacterized protein n=1 Tax=Prunus dulcis TaxID=3755 RepID=A0A5H2XSQ8_PRUDU|nr:hypothetical protein Prudu_1169S002900 [Prunus dulcis]
MGVMDHLRTTEIILLSILYLIVYLHQREMRTGTQDLRRLSLKQDMFGEGSPIRCAIFFTVLLLIANTDIGKESLGCSTQRPDANVT